MKRDLPKVKPSSNLQNITIDVDFVVDLNRISEILASVESVSENMLEMELLWDLKKQAGKIKYRMQSAE